MTRDPIAAPIPAAAAGLPAGTAALIEAMLDAVWIVDGRTLRVIAANQAAGELMATSPHDLVGQDVLALAGTPEDLAFWGEVARGLADRIESDTLVLTAAGTARAVTRRVQPLQTGAAGGAPLFVVVLHDRSEQVRIERELAGVAADLQATLESTRDGILVTDLSGRIRNFNRRFAALWQLPPEMLPRRDDDAVLEWMRRGVVDAAGYMRRLAAIDAATMLQATDVLHLHSGQVLERVTLPQCQNGRPGGRVFSFREITGKV